MPKVHGAYLYEHMPGNGQLCNRTCVREFCIAVHLISPNTQAMVMTCAQLCTHKTVHCTQCAKRTHVHGEKNALSSSTCSNKTPYSQTRTNHFNEVVSRSRLHLTTIWEFEMSLHAVETTVERLEQMRKYSLQNAMCLLAHSTAQARLSQRRDA